LKKGLNKLKEFDVAKNSSQKTGKMNGLTWTLLIIAVLIVGFLGYVATKPNTFTIKRSLDIKAPADKIFANLNDFHNWLAWSPFEKQDPLMKRTFSGEEKGKGAVYDWEGPGHEGKGHMIITEAVSSSRLTVSLEFIKPFTAHNTVEFTLEPKGDLTEVTWSMSGPSPYISKLMGTLFNMDKMVGSEFDTGLKSLKTLSEK
jgi:hypothetical protein